MSIEDDDKAAREVQKTFVRIPLAYIEEQIVDEVRVAMPEGHDHVTLLAVTMKNGFILFGKSVPADPENYDPELGMKFAREDAIRQLWPLFAFALRCNIVGQNVLKDITDRADQAEVGA